MSKPIKRIGVMTTGGDCAGLNAAIRGVVHRARGLGWEVMGIIEGTNGLLERPIRAIPLDLKDVSFSILRQGGTFLGSINKGSPEKLGMADGSTADRSNDVLEGIRLLGLDAVISIGGDGSFGIIKKLLARENFRFIGIPKTIDNDVAQTNMAIGFHSAVAVATEALDRLQPTAASHARVMILEVMGRDAGHIALEAGIAGGADIILIPEIKWSLDSIKKKLESLKASGRNHALIVVSEAAKTLDGQDVRKDHGQGAKVYGGVGDYIAACIAQATGAESRATVLGHVQRGCEPTATDRMIAQAFGVRAVELLAEGQTDRMVAWRDHKVVDVPLEAAIAHYHQVDIQGSLVQTARGLGICLGD